EELDAEIEAARQKLEQLRELRRETSRRFPPLTEPSAPGASNPAVRKDEARATREATSALDEYIAKLQDEVFILQKSKATRDVERAVMEAQNAAMRDGNLLTEDQIKLVRQLATEKQRITEAEKEAEEARRKAEKEAADLLRENERAARDFA